MRRSSLAVSLGCGFRKRILFTDGIEIRFGRFAVHINQFERNVNNRPDDEVVYSLFQMIYNTHLGNLLPGFFRIFIVFTKSGRPRRKSSW